MSALLERLLRVVGMHKNDMQFVMVTQVWQFRGEINIPYKQRRLLYNLQTLYKRMLKYNLLNKLSRNEQVKSISYLPDSSNTEAGGGWLLAKRRNLCLNLSSAAFFPVAFIWTTVTCLKWKP